MEILYVKCIWVKKLNKIIKKRNQIEKSLAIESLFFNMKSWIKSNNEK